MITHSQIESLRSLSFLYSTATVRNIIKTNSLLSIEERVKKHRKNVIDTCSKVSFHNFIVELYAQMEHNYCNEYLYKNTILNKCLIEQYGVLDTVLLDEFKVGKSIADIVLINGEIKIFEIKTDLDSLKRLDNQLKDYQAFANKVYIVTNHKYVEELSKRYSDSPYGILEFKSGCLIEKKEAQTYNNLIDHEVIFRTIRKEEYLNIVLKSFGAIPDVPNTQIFKECLKLIKQIPILEFQLLVIEELKARKIKSPQLLLNNELPEELRFVCYSLNLDNKQYEILYKLLDTTI